MAKNKKSKILAMALCASVMTGIYAAPVMAAEVYVTRGNLTGVTKQNNSDYSFTGGTLNLDDADIAGALNGQNVNLGTGAITANSITSTAGITAASGQFQVYGVSGGIAATSLSLLDNNDSQNVLITNSGMARFGDSNSENVRIENGVLRVFDGNTELASLTSNGLTLNDGTVQGSLTATQLATINSAITTQNNKTVITGDELNIKGASGGLYVRDVVDGKTMIYTKGADAYGTDTVWIDPENGNISTIGTVGVTDDLESGKLITQIQGYDPKNPENTGDIAVGIKADGTQMIHLDASSGSITAANFNGVKLATNGDQVLVGDIDVKNLYDKTEGIDRTVINGARTTTIETVTSFDANGMVVSNENDGRKVAVTNNRGIEVFGGNDVSNAVIAHNGTARFGALNGANVLVENGVLTVNSTGETDVAKLDAQGLTLTSGATEATLSAEQIARLNKVVTQNGKSIVVTADHFKNTKESFAVDSNGAVKAANGKFNVGADGKVAIQYAKDGAIVANENGFAVQKGSAQTVVTNSGIANVYGDNSVNVNKDGVGIAAGKDNTLTVTASGVGMQSGTSQVVVNSADGAVFHNGEDSGHTLINGGNISTYSINADVLNGKNVNDLVEGKDIADDLDDIAGIERKTNNTAASTYIEKTVRVNTESGLVVYAKDGTTFAAQIDREGNGTFTGDVKVDGNVLTEGVGRFGSLAGANVRMEKGVLTINSDATNAVAKLDADGLMLSDAASGEQTLTATKIADIDGITHNGNTTTIEDVLNVSDDGSISAQYADDGAIVANENGFAVQKGSAQTVVTNVGVANIYDDNRVEVNANGVGLAAGLKADGSAAAQISVTDDGIGLQGGTSEVVLNSNNGAVFTNGEGNGETVINGGSVTTGTITADDLHVDNIYLGNQIVDEEGNVVGSDLAIGADGSIKIDNADTHAVEFNATKTALSANYGGTSLNMDSNGFNLSNANNTSFSLGNDGFAFAGPVHLGKGTQVEFRHNGTDISLSSLVNRVENLEQKTQGISFDETTGSTTIADKVGTDGVESNNSMTVGNNGTTFENGTDSKTNINGGAIDADSSSIGDNVSGGSGSGSNGMAGDGTYTDGSEHSGHFVDGDNSYEFTNDANGFTGTVTDGKNTTIIKNGAMGSNTTVTGDGNTSASSGVGIGNDGAFISDSVTNGDMTVTEVKDKNGSATTVKDANGSSTVSQDTKGQTVSTGTGTSVNTGNDFGVTDNETGKSIYMSDIGHVEDIDSEIQNSDGSKTTVVDAVNNEAEIRRNEIERVDGRINNLENRVGELEDRIDKVGAMAAAIANLRTMGYDPAAPTEVAVGIGQYRDETGAALGLFHYPNRDFMLSLSVSTSGDEVMGGIGATWKFGRKSPEKVAEIKKAQAEADARRAEEAKLAKAEEMKQAAKEAKIKAQQERHAKLAAERAAQAEAAK